MDAVVVEKKEVKELVVGLMEIATLLAKQFKDGVDVADFAVIMAKIESDAVLKAKLMAAYEGIDKIPAEAKELGMVDFASIAVAVVQELPELIAAIKG